MFRMLSRVLAKFSAGMTPNRCLPKKTLGILSRLLHSHRPLAVQSPQFCVSVPEKSVFKKIGAMSDFAIGSTRFIFSISEFESNKKIILCITENDKETIQHKCHIWTSIAAAKTLLEKLKAYGPSALDKSSIKSCMNVPMTEFVDHERQHLVRLTLENDRIGNIGIKIKQQNLVEDKGSAIFVPLEGIALFQSRLTNILRNYDILVDPIFSKRFEDLYRSNIFSIGPKSYFLSLSKSNADNAILLGIVERNYNADTTSDLFIPIETASGLFGLLKEAYEFIQSHEGKLPDEKQPLDVLYKKRFSKPGQEYFVQVYVSELERRNHGFMTLTIQSRSQDESLNNLIKIRSLKANLLLHYYEKMLQKYDRLKPSMVEANPPKDVDLSKEQRIKLRDQELAALKSDTMAKLAALENSTVSKEKLQKEIAALKEEHIKQINEIFYKYKCL